MKIISKYKDYYDYVVYKYGIDPLKVYIRKPAFYYENSKIEWRFGNFDFDPYLKRFGDYAPIKRKIETKDGVKEIKYNKSFQLAICGRIYYLFYLYGKLVGWSTKTNNSSQDEKTDLNEKHNSPIIILGSFGRIIAKDIILKQLNFGSIIGPEEMFLLVQDFVSKKELPEITQSDKSKIISKGFDIKKSFRHRKDESKNSTIR